jgi:hypothetical protein
MGPRGFTGPQGPVGPAGPVGPEGPQGIQGIQGPPGPTGPAGITGPAGPTGPKGDAGPEGPKGEPGSGSITIGDSTVDEIVFHPDLIVEEIEPGKIQVSLPVYAEKETVSCFFPLNPPLNSVLIWTAGVDVNFPADMQAVGFVTSNPNIRFEISVLNRLGNVVGTISVNNTGLVTFNKVFTSSSLTISKGEILMFKVTRTDPTVQNVSFTLTGKRF